MTENKILYLSQSNVASVGVTMKEIIEALLIAFREHGTRRVEMPPKPGVHTQPDAFIHAMPAYIPALHSVGVKWVSGYPHNLGVFPAAFALAIIGFLTAFILMKPPGIKT